MQKYYIIATKSQKKYKLIMSAESIKEVQEKIHNEGYSILKIEEFNEFLWEKSNLNRFIFYGEKWWIKKRGVIAWEDILKLYIKLKDELWYDIDGIYPENDPLYDDKEEIRKLTDNVSNLYALQKKKNSYSVKGQKKQINNNDINYWSVKSTSEDFYLKKQLESVHNLLDVIIWKLETLFNEREKFSIDDEMYSKLQNIYEKIITIKKSSNLSKLKQIGEVALIKIGEIELRWIHIKK